MADAKGGSEAAALMEIAKMVNELRNSVLLLGLIVGKVNGSTPSQHPQRTLVRR